MNNAFIYILALFAFPSSYEGGMPAIADKYISQYKDIAISEMARTGIPASIKLAQGLLESDWGRSSLASTANNHFGIKCGNSWEGESFFKEDDDYHKGKLISSCFRSYDNPYQSYIDHSDFLSKPRYQFLYTYDMYDYKAWAKGLRKAGYATDKKYPKKLIQIIEKYELYVYDTQTPSEEYLASNQKQSNKKEEDIVFSEKNEQVYRSEHIEAVEISGKKHTGKRKSAKPFEGQTFHTVGLNESMKEIASLHKIDLKQLYAMNRMPFGSAPLEGEMIKLTGKLRLDTKVKYVRFPTQADPDSVFLF